MIVELVDTWEGKGRVRLAPGHSAEISYEIDLWRVSEHVLIGKGYIEGPVDAMFTLSLSQGPISLTLSDGSSVNAMVTERGAGRSWAKIYVPRPLPEPIPTPWPTLGAGDFRLATLHGAA
jgi:hypothetical protein